LIGNQRLGGRGQGGNTFEALEKRKMPYISLKGTTGTTKTKRVGDNIIVEKTIEKGVLKETHKEPGRRVTGKQPAKDLVKLSAAEIKAFAKDTEEKIARALKEGKETNKKQLMSMNLAANKMTERMETSHRATMKTVSDKLARTETDRNNLQTEMDKMIEAKKEKREKKEEKKGKASTDLRT
jgi:hypothetical protein